MRPDGVAWTESGLGSDRVAAPRSRAYHGSARGLPPRTRPPATEERTVLNPDRIQPMAVQSVLLYPPTVRLERGKLTQLYSAVCAYKPYAQFAFLPDGARMLNDDGSFLKLGPDRFTYKERIPDNQSTYATVRDFERMVHDFWDAFTPGVFVVQETLLEAVWPVEDRAAPELLEEHFLRFGRAEAAGLGAPCAGIGLKLVFPSFAPAKTVELRLEPYFRDPSQLFLALSSQDVQPVQAPGAAGDRVRWLERFLGHEVATFVRSHAGT